MIALAYGELVAAVLVVALLVSLVAFIRLHRELGNVQSRLEALAPPNLDALADMARSATTDSAMAMRRVDELAARYDGLQADLQATIQRVGVVRFNPFRDTGGDQSFAVALLDELGNGVVLSGLHNRSGTRVFAKPVHGGKSEYALSQEEHQAIAQADGLGVPAESPARARATPAGLPS